SFGTSLPLRSSSSSARRRGARAAAFISRLTIRRRIPRWLATWSSSAVSPPISEPRSTHEAGSVDSLPPSPNPKERPLSFVSAAVWSLLAYLLWAFFAQMAKGGRDDVYLDMVTLTTCEVLAYSVVFFAILRVH